MAGRVCAQHHNPLRRKTIEMTLSTSGAFRLILLAAFNSPNNNSRPSRPAELFNSV